MNSSAPLASGAAAILAAAHADAASVLDLTIALVRQPTRGGIDDYGPAIAVLADWCRARGIAPEVIRNGPGLAVGIAITVDGRRPGPTWVFDACLDTAGFGDEHAWTHPPCAAVVDRGWLHGRGAADSKAAVAVLCHLAARLQQTAETLAGRIVFLFDLDEHTGGFAGARTFFAQAPDAAGVMIAYPGIDELVVGGRGVHRSRLTVFGTSGHSGSSRPVPNAIAKAAAIITALHQIAPPPPAPAAAFPPPGKVTVTAVHGGEGFSVNPDRCEINVDVRTTPEFDSIRADALVGEAVAAADAAWPGTEATVTDVVTSWPPYALAEDAPLRTAILESAATFGLRPRPKIAGPSNIGNFLAGLGIPATAGFGVDYMGLHAVDERIRIDSIPLVQAAYHATALKLLDAAPQ